MKYKNVIFDVGNVLLEWDPARFLEELELPKHLLEVFNSLLWGMHDGGLLSRDEVVAKLPPQYDREVFAYCMPRIAPFLRPIGEMVELFHEVRRRGYKVYILSNMPKEMHEELVQLHDFFRHPDGQIYSYQVKAIKPQPEIYEALLSTYKIKGSESIFIDDREENIRAAERFEIKGIVCRNPAEVKKILYSTLAQ